jgi:26S proteasome regulatory subunit N1
MLPGSADGEVAAVLVCRLMEASPAELDVPLARMLGVSLGLLFLGRQETADAMLESLDTIAHEMGKFCKIILQGCAYAGTGNVLMVQKMLHYCSEHPQGEEEKKQEADAAAAATAGGPAPAKSEIKTTKFVYQVCCRRAVRALRCAALARV